ASALLPLTIGLAEHPQPFTSNVWFNLGIGLGTLGFVIVVVSVILILVGPPTVYRLTRVEPLVYGFADNFPRDKNTYSSDVALGSEGFIFTLRVQGRSGLHQGSDQVLVDVDDPNG